MQPTINAGQCVLVSALPYLFSKPKIGDIAVFKKEQKLILKRITLVKSNQYLVQGDNKKDSLDFWILKSQIQGKVILTIC